MTTSDIRRFFENQTVFLTGGTGFLGKILIDKLLRECSNLTKIYVLMRPKKGKTAQQRFDELFNYPCFDPLKSKNPKFASKISLIDGDCKMPSLGLSEAAADLLVEEVTCVIHAAANVKFDQTLREASHNVRATRDLLELAQKMSKLRAFVHVSTAYSNAIHTTIKEQFYEPPMKAESLFGIIDDLDDDVIQAITPHLLGEWPNTYIYTKSIAEDVVRTVGENLPTAIVRPAIVVSTMEEPIPGWIDNFYGVIGIVAGAALGVIRSLHAKPDNKANMVPVDYVANVVLAAAWNAEQEKGRIYNFVGHGNTLTWRKFMDLVEPYCWAAATEKVVWYYCFKIRENELWHKTCVLFLHTVPAYIVDFVLICLGKPPLAITNYRRLDRMLDLISYFTTNMWHFDDGNVTKMWDKMGDEDKRIFKFNMEDVDWNEFIHNGVFGARLYLLKDSIDTIPKGNKKLKILFVAHYTIIALLCYLLYKLVMLVLGFIF